MSPKDLYRFDKENFVYRKIKRGIGFYAGRGLPYLFVTLLVAFGVTYVFYYFYDSPETRRLKQEQAALASAVQFYQGNIDSLRTAIQALQERDKALYRQILNAEPPKDSTRDTSDTDVALITESEDLAVIESRVTELNKLLQAQTETQQQLVEMAKANKKELAHIPSIRPVKSDVISGFGKRRNPIFKKDMFHAGMDFRADLGTEVVATAEGTVVRAGSAGNGSGIVVDINHGNGYLTRYGHLQKVLVRPGRRVKRGDVIAHSGNSGLSKGPHLYYEVRKDNKPVDPIDYFFHDLKPEELARFRQQASQYNESMN